MCIDDRPPTDEEILAASAGRDAALAGLPPPSMGVYGESVDYHSLSHNQIRLFLTAWGHQNFVLNEDNKLRYRPNR